jgi:RNA polymerase sigma-70 factor (ECF subfamily)
VVTEQFADFYAATKNAAYATVLSAIGDPTATDDALAEAYTRALSRWGRLREHPEPLGWVVVTALNVHRSWWRRVRREIGGLHVDHPIEPVPLMAVNPALRAEILRLPHRQREVLGLRLVAGLSAERTAYVLGIAEATVHVHLHRALATLRARLDLPVTAPKGTSQ